MKKYISLILAVTMAVSLSGCSLFGDAVLDSLGSYTSEKVYSHGGWQDYTDYGKYQYDSARVENNKYFQPVTETETLKEYIVNFEGWLEAIERNDPDDTLVVNYDFDTGIISADDYLYIYNDPDYPEFGNYKVYFFDTETNTLYYFHSNI